MVARAVGPPFAQLSRAMRLPARLLPTWERIAGAVLVESAAIRLSASDLDAVPPELAPLLGRTCSELATAGDGACALHAAFGTPDVTTDQVRLENGRSFLRETLGEVFTNTDSILKRNLGANRKSR